MTSDQQKRVEWSSAFRLIPSRFPPVELYESIAPKEDWDALKRIEAMTNPRLTSDLNDLLPEDQGKIAQNWLIAPFTYPDPEPSLYGDGSYGFSIVAESLHSALLVAIRGREAFLRRTSQGPTRLVMRVLKVQIDAVFVDLCQHETSDPPLRELIKAHRAAKAHGVLVTGPRGKSDQLAVVLRPTAFVPPAVQAEHYTFMWNGERIHQIFAFPDTKVIDPKDLVEPASRTAA